MPNKIEGILVDVQKNITKYITKLIWGGGGGGGCYFFKNCDKKQKEGKKEKEIV